MLMIDRIIKICATGGSYGKGEIEGELDERIDRKRRRFTGDGAAYTYVAMEAAIADAGLEPADISNERTGLVIT